METRCWCAFNCYVSDCDVFILVWEVDSLVLQMKMDTCLTEYESQVYDECNPNACYYNALYSYCQKQIHNGYILIYSETPQNCSLVDAC